MAQPLLGRTAYALLHFLELLVGPRCQQLDVDNPQVQGSSVEDGELYSRNCLIGDDGECVLLWVTGPRGVVAHKLHSRSVMLDSLSMSYKQVDP